MMHTHAHFPAWTSTCAAPPPRPTVVHLTFTTHPNKVHGHFGFPPYPHLRQPCAPATCSAPADWAHHLPVVRRAVVTAGVAGFGLRGASGSLGEPPAAGTARGWHLYLG